MAVQTYTVYTRCNQCGVYDRDPVWCALCGRPKDSSLAAECEPARGKRVPAGNGMPPRPASARQPV